MKKESYGHINWEVLVKNKTKCFFFPLSMGFLKNFFILRSNELLRMGLVGLFSNLILIYLWNCSPA